MRIAAIGLSLLIALAGCAVTRSARDAAAPVDIRIIGLNDFHGSLDFPKLSIEAVNSRGEIVRVPAGGAAYLASAIDTLKAENANTVVVGAGDLIGASPLSSSLFLDEPAIIAMNMMGLEFNAVGNHEFDRGTDELLRMQRGGCEKFTKAEPCRVDRPFPGAKFRQLAANTVTGSGETLFPSYGIKSFGAGRRQVKIGFIGLTLKGTANLVSLDRIEGITFADEANTANALVPKLKAEGADAIVVLIHQGVYTKAGYSDPQCGGISGELMPIIDRLDPAIDVVVSGHTHWAYACEYGRINPVRPILLTSAGYKGQFVTAIDLKIDPVANRVVSKSARNIIVQSEAYVGPRTPMNLQPDFPVFPPREDIAALAKRYAEAAKVEESRVVGSLAGAATRDKTASGESLIGNLVADAQLAAAKPQGAQIALMNPDGLRADIVPDAQGNVTFGSAFVAQPFGNPLVTMTLTGRQIRAALEQQFTNPNWIRILSPSAGFRFSYDMNRPVGQRIVATTLNGAAIEDNATYRVAMSEFLSNGGDLFDTFKSGTDKAVGPVDIDALIAWLSKGGPTPLPALDRVINLTR